MNFKSIIKKTFNYMRGKCIVYVREVSRPYELQIIKANRFRGQVAVVTGASGVIGRAIAYRMASEGAIVYTCGTKIEKINSVVEEITKDGYVAKPCIFNLLDESSIIKAFNDICTESGKIDLLVCCAGGGARENKKRFVEQSSSVIDSVLKINLRGSMLCVREALKMMVEKKYGNIVLISSTVGVCGMSEYSEYAAAKAGIIAFMKSISMEYGKNGIRANCVSPGIVERGTIDNLKMERIKRTNWLGDYGKPEDIANMVAYLNSTDASFITGQNFIVDGGRSLGLKGE